jgi:PAS domain S-box-containing protein
MIGGIPWRAQDASRVASLSQAIIEHLPDALIILDKHDRIQFANRAAESLFGRTGETLLGAPFGHPVIEDAFAEIEIVRRGSSMLVEVRVADILWSGECGRLVALRDVTDRKRIEERVRDLERERTQADVANRAKSDFLAMMSHELRTPLNAIVGYAELLDLGVDGQLNPRQQQHIDRLRQSSKHLLGLVNDVLDLSRLEAGRLTVDRRVALVNGVLNHAMEVISPVAGARGIDVSVQCPDGSSAFEGDEARARQILINLLQNSVKFTAEGGKIVVSCGTRPPPAEARLPHDRAFVFIEVSDTGIGIPADHLAAVFDPFFRIDSGHARRTEGSGLGLSISRRLARLMGGDITLESEPGKGSRFTLWLPARVKPRSSGRAASPSSDRRTDLSTPAPSIAADRAPGDRAALADAGECLIREAVGIVAGLVARLRHQEDVQSAAKLRYGDLANHLVSFIASLGETLVAMSEQGTAEARSVEEGVEILQVMADRHGRHRSRMGWTSAAVESEWRMLGDEIERSLIEQSSQLPPRTIDKARTVIQQLLLEAEARSRRTLHASGAERE